MAHPRLSILGVPVSALRMADLLKTIDGWINRRERHYVCTLDVHALTHSQAASDVLDVYRSASVVAPDGMPLVWLLRQAGHRHAERLCGPDLMPAVFDHSQHAGHRHFLYGSSDATLALLKSQLLARFPNAIVTGSYSPPYRDLTPGEARDMLLRLNAANPDVIWVGLGAPKQDLWMATYRDQLNAPVLIGVGAAFDFMAGTVRRAPHFLQHSGFEWAYRVMQEPRRLWKRYLLSNTRFATLLLQEIWLRERTREHPRNDAAIPPGKLANAKENSRED